MTFFPVIMCGGSGTRLWPLSRSSRPKQFIPLVGSLSPFRGTLDRVRGLEPVATPLIVAGQSHGDWLAREAQAAGAEIEVLLEPQARDSAPAVAVAAALIASRDPSGVVVILAADHHVPDAEAFRASLRLAAKAAAEGWIVTMGIDPIAPATAYGYIRPGEILAGLEPVRRNLAFVEKPDAATAETYVRQGYLWNSGNFIARADVLLAELERFEPAILESVKAALAEAESTPTGLRLGPSFTTATKKSFDYAVMEKTDRAAVLPASFAWSDLGAWDAIWSAAEKDEAGNVLPKGAIAHGATDCLVNVAGGLQVALVGVKGLAVVADDASLLVCDMAHSQGVKAAAEAAAKAATAVEPAKPDLSVWSERYDRWFRTAALPAWWALGGDHGRGGFFELVGQDGVGVAADKRSRVQTRQTFTYARAVKLGLSGPWLQAAQHGWRFFETFYRRPDGLYRSAVAADGSPVDDEAYLYDQAFALMALAALHEVDPQDGARLAAGRALLQAIQGRFAHSGGGYQEAGNRRFQSNAQMHLLEAALAWIEADGAKVWTDLANALVTLALDRLIDPDRRAVREFFSDDWSPAEGAAGRIVEPGHQFEWAWLLDRWAHMSGSEPAASAALALFKAGLEGWDASRAVAVDELDERLSVKRATARLWPQTEMLKAAILLGRDREGDPIDFAAWAEASAASLWRYLETPVVGLWRDEMSADGSFKDAPAPASSLYHLFGAVQGLIRVRAD
ncbi:AGE family epimerase/isomerase [Phenylobacterium montanum]|uniref:AGE family epimerase/isomerase n=1 Tax=Phenylobacterium montanum TaxID=2823693 RepID=A0A975IVQ8_9CAUL|nr:AGE family epimerase/isomerase [Caulobacter sp. S6]QUD89103.1 AGE family epimerase/isomerase [Caulobacter sp. S6]